MNTCIKTLLIKAIKCFLFIFLPLVLGLLIYLVSDDDSIIKAAFVRSIGKTAFGVTGNYIINTTAFRILRNYGCDFCWAFSLESCLAAIYGKSQRNAYASLITSLAFISLIEVSQYFEIINGTFDIVDIIVEAVSAIIAGVVIYFLEGYYEKNRKNN